MASFMKVPCLVQFVVFNVNVHKCMLIIFKYLHMAPSRPQLHKRASDSSIPNDPCAINIKTRKKFPAIYKWIVFQNFPLAGLDDDSLTLNVEEKHVYAILPIAMWWWAYKLHLVYSFMEAHLMFWADHLNFEIWTQLNHWKHEVTPVFFSIPLSRIWTEWL